MSIRHFLYISHHQLILLQKLRLFCFPPLHSSGFCCDRVYALAFLLQRLDDHKLMIELGSEPQKLDSRQVGTSNVNL